MKEIIILLCGGDKRTQQANITNTKKMPSYMRMIKRMGTVTKTRKPAKAKKKVTFSKLDPAEIITTKERVIAFLEENDPDFLLETIGHIARSKGMAQIARELKLDRVGLYKSLAPDGNPSFKTVYKLLDILGLQMKLEKKSDSPCL